MMIAFTGLLFVKYYTLCYYTVMINAFTRILSNIILLPNIIIQFKHDVKNCNIVTKTLKYQANGPRDKRRGIGEGFQTRPG